MIPAKELYIEAPYVDFIFKDQRWIVEDSEMIVQIQ